MSDPRIPVTQVEEIAATVARLLEADPEVRFVYLHGSLVRWTPSPDSDVDVAVVVAHDLARDRGRLWKWGIDAELRIARALWREVDLVVLNDADLPFQASVVQTGRLLLERDGDERVEWEARIQKLWWDEEPRMRQYLRQHFERLLAQERCDAP